MNADKLLMKLSSYRIPFSIPLVLLGFFWILSTRAAPESENTKEKTEAKSEKYEKTEKTGKEAKPVEVIASTLSFRDLGIQDPERDRPFEARATAVNSSGTIFLSCKKTVYQVTGQGLKEIVTPPDDVRVMAFDASDMLYIGTKDGLYRHRDGALELLFEDEVRTMQFVTRNLLLLGTKSNGLFLVDVLSDNAVAGN